MADSTSAAREKAWREYADKIEVDYTAPTVQDDFKAGWDALVAVLGPRLATLAAGWRILEGAEKYLPDKEGHIALRLYAALERLAKAEQRCKLLESENSRCASILDDALSFCLLSPNEPASQALRDRILLSRTLAPHPSPHQATVPRDKG